MRVWYCLLLFGRQKRFCHFASFCQAAARTTFPSGNRKSPASKVAFDPTDPTCRSTAPHDRPNGHLYAGVYRLPTSVLGVVGASSEAPAHRFSCRAHAAVAYARAFAAPRTLVPQLDAVRSAPAVRDVPHGRRQRRPLTRPHRHFAFAKKEAKKGCPHSNSRTVFFATLRPATGPTRRFRPKLTTGL